MKPNAFAGYTKLIFTVGILGIAAGTVGIRFAPTPDWIRFFDNCHWTFGTATGALLAGLGWLRARHLPSASALAWFAAGFGFYAVGQIVWDIQTWTGYSQFPSYSDWFYLWLGPCLTVGVGYEIRAHIDKVSVTALLLDLMSLLTAGLALILGLYLPQGSGVGWLPMSVLIAYPLTLLIPSAMIFIMIPAMRLRLSRPLLLFFLGLSVTSWSWMKWNLMALTGTAIDGNWFNISFSAAILLAGYATTLWPLEYSGNAQWDRLCEGFLRLLPLIAVVAACGAVIVTGNSEWPPLVEQLINAAALLVIIFAMCRQWLLLRERDLLIAAQSEVVRSKSLLKIIVDTVPIRVFWKDTECRYLGCNALFARDAGFVTPEQLVGKDDFSMGWSRQAELYRNDDLAVIFSGKVKLAYEEPQTTPEGETIWLRTSKVPLRDESGTIIGVLGIYDDITEQKQINEQLALFKSRLQFLLDSTPVVIYSSDYSYNCRTTYISSNIEYYGYQPEDFLNEPDFWIDRVHPEDRQILALGLQRLIQNPINAFEYRFRRANGDYCWIRDHMRLINGPDGEPSEIVGCMVDISDRKSAEEKFRLMSRIFRDTEECIMVTDADCNVINVNKAFSTITGYSKEEVLGRNPRLLKSDRQSDEFYAEMWGAIHTKGHWRGEIWNRRKNGDLYAEWITISSVLNEHGDVMHYVSIASDITVFKRHQEQLEYIAHYDALTGVPNRLLLSDRLNQALKQTQREGKMMAVCYLDLDGFKSINDNFGHDIGDQVLIQLAKRIQQTIRASDTVARLGGDEFVVLLPGLNRIEEGVHSLNRLIECIALSMTIRDRHFNVTASIGVTMYPQDDEGPDTLLRHADQAMYAAKQSGKNHYHIYDPQQDAEIIIRRKIKQTIIDGLSSGEFELFYQPKVELRRYQVIGVEALIRWRNPERGLLPPSEFLRDIEACDLTVEVGEWVIATALNQLDLWQQQGLNIGVSINIAAPHLQMPNFIDSVGAALAKHPDLAPQSLEIEILETAALYDVLTVVDIIESGLALGIHFALDDFGTGYSSLAYLRRLPVETIKIDQTFVRDMLVDRDDLAIVEGVIALAHTFKRFTVAEGVETREHFQILQKMGCDICQGYGIAKPMPGSEFKDWYKAFDAKSLILDGSVS